MLSNYGIICSIISLGGHLAEIMLKKISIVTILGIILYVLKRAISLNGIVNIEQLYTNSMALENLNNLMQIIAGFFVIAGTLIAVWQYVLSSRDSKRLKQREYELHEKEIFEMEKDRVQKAIDLAGYFKDYIIRDVSVLMQIYTKTDIKEILEKVDFDQISHFDRYEMERVISAADRNRIKEVRRDPKILGILVQASDITGLWKECTEAVNIEEKDGEVVKSVKISSSALLYHFQILLRDLLNNLEYFAMNFTHNTADETVIYQSLHKVYAETVHWLYYDISVNNNPGEAKLYTNVIELYNIWSAKAKKQKEDETAAARENISKGKSLKLLDKK